MAAWDLCQIPFLVAVGEELVPAGLSPVDSVNWHFLCAFREASWFCSGIFVESSSVDLSGLPIPAVVHSTAGHTDPDVELQACGRSFDPLQSASELCKLGNGLQIASAIVCILGTSTVSCWTSRVQSWQGIQGPSNDDPVEPCRFCANPQWRVAEPLSGGGATADGQQLFSFSTRVAE